MHEIILIAALSADLVIGKDNKLPWHIPQDLKRFKALTTGHTILMGCNTFKSVGLLPNRTSLIVSRTLKPLDIRPDFAILPSVEDAIQLSKDQGDEKLFVVGGAQIYAYTLPLVDRLELTIVDGHYEGDTRFPEYRHLLDVDFRITREEFHPGFSFKTYNRF